MGIFDSVMDGLQQQAAGAIAAKLGIDPSMAQSAIEALTKNHAGSGNTVEQSAQQTGISPDILTQIVSQVGGTGGLGGATARFATLIWREATSTHGAAPSALASVFSTPGPAASSTRPAPQHPSQVPTSRASAADASAPSMADEGAAL